MFSRRFAATSLAVSILFGISVFDSVQAQNSAKPRPVLRGDVSFNEKLTPQKPLRLSRKGSDQTNPANQPALNPIVKQTPTMDTEPPPPSPEPKAKPATFALDASQSAIYQQTLATTIASCYTLIATGVNARQLAVPEELAVQQELQQIVAQNNAYAAKGYTQAEFQEIQAKLVTLQVHIYQYGTNNFTRQ